MLTITQTTRFRKKRALALGLALGAAGFCGADPSGCSAEVSMRGLSSAGGFSVKELNSSQGKRATKKTAHKEDTTQRSFPRRLIQVGRLPCRNPAGSQFYRLPGAGSQ